MRDPDDLDDYLAPEPLYKLRSRHKGDYRGRAKSESCGIPSEFKRKRVRFIMPLSMERYFGLYTQKSGWPYSSADGGNEFSRMEEDKPVFLKDISWGNRVFTPRYIVQCWMEHYRECPIDFVRRNFLYWYNLGKNWGWDEEYFLDEAKQVIVVSVARCLPPQFWPGSSLQAR